MDTVPKSHKNKHLNASECYKLEGLLKAKVRVLKIAEILGRDKSRIYREIKRGTVELRNSDWSVIKNIVPIIH